MNIEKGISLTENIVVKNKDLAINVGSGSLAVYGTPAMIAHMEGTSMRLIKKFLNDGEDSVGIAISTSHIKASALNEKIEISAKVVNVDNRKISLEIIATDSKGDKIGEAKHDRFIINEKKFMERV